MGTASLASLNFFSAICISALCFTKQKMQAKTHVDQLIRFVLHSTHVFVSKMKKRKIPSLNSSSF